MEKLQKALWKARAERNTLPAHKPGGEKAGAPVEEVPNENIPAVWRGLTPINPSHEALLHNRVMTLEAEAGANPFDVLRTKIFLLMRKNGWTRMAITSPGPDCGKTTLACNLAVGFSRQEEVKTILLDMDLRRPSVARVLGQETQHDIGEMLEGKVLPQQQMMRLRSNVAISMAKRSQPDPVQLLLARSTAVALDALQSEFEPDIMIFDLPPMLSTDDTRAVLNNVDCALIVARAEQTKVSQLDICEREIAEYTNVLGVVLNNCRHLQPEQAYYGAYG